MKIVKYLALFIAISFFISCSDDDSTPIDTGAQQSDLIGTWNLAEVTHDGTATATIQNIPVTGNVDAFGKNIDAQVKISENPNNLTASGGYTAETTVSIATENFEFDLPIVLNEVLSQSSWTLNSGIITLTNGGETLDLNITELNKTSLKIEFDFILTVPVPAGLNIPLLPEGTPIELDIKVNMSFTK